MDDSISHAAVAQESTGSNKEILGPHATFQIVPFGKTTIDLYSITDIGRTTVDQAMGKAYARVTAHPVDQAYFVTFDQSTVKTAVLMSPYLKHEVERVYAATKFKMYVAVIVNDGFLDLDSKAFLQRQETVRNGLIDTQFFLTLQDGMAWMQNMATREGLAE